MQPQRLILLAALTCAWTSAALAQQVAQQVMSPELLWRLKRVSSTVVSPSGRDVVFAVSEYDVAENRGNTDLYLVSIDGGLPRRLTDFPGREGSPEWRADGRKIGFLSARGGSTQLWEIDPDATNARQVSNVEGGIDNFRYAPDGARVSFTRRVKLDRTPAEVYPDLPKANARIIDGLMYRHWDSWRDYDYSHLFVAEYRDGALGQPVDVMPGERFDTPVPPFGGVEQIGWSPDGRRLAYTAKKQAGVAFAMSTNTDIYVYDVTTRETRNLTESNGGYDVEPVFSPDGRAMAWLSMARDGYESDRNRLFVHDFAKGQSREVTQGFDQDAHAPVWSTDGRTIYLRSETRGTIQLYAVPASGGPARRITDGQHDYGTFDLSETEKGAFLVAERMSMSAAVDIYRVDVRSGEAVPLTAVNNAVLDGVTLGRVERRMVKATDGQDVVTWVIYPPNFDRSRRYPALLYAQGGPQSAVSQFFSYRWNFQTIAAQGYIIVAPNRRGVPGLGQAFKEQVSRDWGGQAMRDLLSAIDEVAKEPYVDRDRLGAIGASFGGYTVFWLAGHHEGRFKTFVAHAGVFNLESMYAATEELFFVNFDLGGPSWKTPRPESYDKDSPHLFASRWKTPMLVIHGEKDFRVPVGEGMQAFTALQAQGIESRFLYFPEEGHWILTPQNGVLWHRVVFDWLRRYLKP